jgi:hypothetical protein
MELSADQIIVVGLIASVVTQLLKLLADKAGFKPGKVVVNIGLLIVAVVLALFWGGFNAPAPGGDPMEFAVALLEQAIAVFGFASLIYNLLLKDVVYPAIKLG